VQKIRALHQAEQDRILCRAPHVCCMCCLSMLCWVTHYRRTHCVCRYLSCHWLNQHALNFYAHLLVMPAGVSITSEWCCLLHVLLHIVCVHPASTVYANIQELASAVHIIMFCLGTSLVCHHIPFAARLSVVTCKGPTLSPSCTVPCCNHCYCHGPCLQAPHPQDAGTAG
jgi:hypothetical protein